MGGILIYPRGDRMLAELEHESAPLNTIAIGAESLFIGAPVVTIAIAVGPKPGQWVCAPVDLALLLTAAEAFVAVHGDPRGRPLRFPPAQFARSLDPVFP